MLTRIEIDGFKTFQDFELDVPPFLVVVGRNASGKSNLFDAIQFLRWTADMTLPEAVGHSRGDISELFHRTRGGSGTWMDLAVEVLLDKEVTDDFGDKVEVPHARLRYELRLVQREAQPVGARRLYVEHERVTLIRKGEDAWSRRFAKPGSRDQLSWYSRRSSEVLLETTRDAEGRPVFKLYQDRVQGRPRTLPAADATSTVLSTLTTASEFPMLYALRRELSSWSLLQLDPASLRRTSSFDDSDELSLAGDNLANTLHRIAAQTHTQDSPSGILPEIASDLSAIVPEVQELRIDEDQTRRQRSVVVVTKGDAPYSARVASDGTLRALALLVVLHDPAARGLVCFEEPENGIYPQRLVTFVRHLRDLVMLSFERRCIDESHRPSQLIVSSHSPVILRALDSQTHDGVRDDVVYIDTVTRTAADPGQVSRVRFVRGDASATGQLKLPAALFGKVVSQSEIEDFEVVGALG